MKVVIFLVAIFCHVECGRKAVPIDKNANLAFINMESGGARPNVAPVPPKPTVTPAPAPVPTQPAKPTPTQPAKPAPTPAPSKPIQPLPQPTPKPLSVPVPLPNKPVQPTQPNQILPKPVNPSPAANPISTPGPGSVKQLINFYDSQGKASPIRPYSYSQAVKQGKQN